MSSRNVASLDRRLQEVLNDLYDRVRRVERRRPTGTGGGICDCEDGAPGADGPTGATGPAGAAGATGPAGPGVPTGGTSGQFLIKQSGVDYDAAWDSFSGVEEINDLSDVDTASNEPDDGDVLTWVDADSQWEPMAPSGGGSFVIGDATDVNTTGADPGDVLRYDGADWIPDDLTLNDLSDVDTTGVATGNHLAYDGSDWVDSSEILIPDAGGSSLPAIGTEGKVIRFKHVLFEDNGLYWWPHGGRMEQIQWEWSHFFNNNAQKWELQSSTSGGTTGGGTPSAGNQGILTLDTSTSSTGRAGYAAGQSSALRGTADKIMHAHTRVRFPTLSTGTERYQFVAGYISSFTAEPGDGFYFRYDDSVSANWYCVTANNSSRTATDSTVAVATNTFQKLRIEIDEIAGTAKFYIDDVLKVTTSSSTNFPGSARDHGPGFNMRKSVGTTSRTVDVDYFGYWSLMTTTV